VIWSGTRNGVGAGTVTEAVARVRAGLRPQLGGIADVERVLLVVDLEDQPHRAGHELLLVGLDTQRDAHQLGPVLGRARPALAESLLEPRREPLTGRRTSASSGGGSTARHRVGHRVEHLAHDLLGLGRVVGPVGPGAGQQSHAFVVGVVERAHPPARR
jgi:hypothetical protein